MDRLNVKALALAGGVLWGFYMLFAGWAAVRWLGGHVWMGNGVCVSHVVGIYRVPADVSRRHHRRSRGFPRGGRGRAHHRLDLNPGGKEAVAGPLPAPKAGR